MSRVLLEFSLLGLRHLVLYELKLEILLRKITFLGSMPEIVLQIPQI